MIRVQELMSKPVITCHQDESLSAAAKLLWDHDCGSIVVVDGEARVTGMLTDRDICMATYTQGKAPYELAVRDAMAKQVYSCHATDTIKQVLSRMKQGQIRRLPVVDVDNFPLGMISLNTLIRYTGAGDSSFERELIETLTAISQPRGAMLPECPPARSSVWQVAATLALPHG
jgi:CBS domain-containing protein